MKTHLFIFFIIALFPAACAAEDAGAGCVGCHAVSTPAIVSDWRQSAHAGAAVSCVACHGDKHTRADDAAKAELPGLDTCASCHAARVAQYKKGKHALAWSAMKAMPTLHWQPMVMVEGREGCGGCHRIGLKSADEVRQLRSKGEAGVSGCDSCHTRHTFSAKEAAQPQSCQTCHMGFDHAQWEMYSSSKHGVRHELAQRNVLSAEAAAPTCQTCHMPDGDHGVRTAWGFLGVRLPMPERADWARDRATILKALGVLDPQGQRAKRFEAVKKADICRLSKEDFTKEREKMARACSRCHGASFVKQELDKGDQLIRQADRLMAAAIREVEGLYRDGCLKKPEHYAFAYPDILAFHDAPTPIEQKLFLMLMEHRMRVYQGAFHCNPDYTFWYGWSEMVRDLTEIRAMAQELRKRQPPKKKKAAPPKPRAP